MTGRAMRSLPLRSLRVRTRVRRLPGARRPRRTRVLVATTAMLLPAGAAVAGIDQGYPAAQVPLRAGIAWLASNQVGQLTLLDGSAAEVSARVPVAQPGSSLVALQQGVTGYAVNRTEGSIVRVDSATFQTVRQRPLPRAREQLQAFSGADSLYALDGRRGTLAVADPGTLAARQQPVTLAADVQPDTATVDAAGRVWVLDPAAGDLIWSAGGERRARPRAGTPGNSVLTAVGGKPVLVDLARRTAQLLDPESGEVERSLRFELQAHDRVLVSGASKGDRLHLVVTTQSALLTCSFSAGSCAAPVRLGNGPAELGPAVEAQGRTLVPDYASGAVSIVDQAQARVVAKPVALAPPPVPAVRPLNPAPHPFELLVRDGVVFYNDPNGVQAGVIDPDGRVRRVQKYDAARPQNGTGQTTGVAPQRPPGSGPAPGRQVGPPGGPGTRPAADRGRGPGMRNGILTINVRPGTRGAVGQDFSFSVSARNRAKIANVRWTFGDGTLTRAATAKHRWSREGTYRVSVRAAVGGRNALAGVSMVIGKPSPDGPPRIARLSVDPLRPRVGQPTRMSAVLTGSEPERRVWTVVPIERRTPGGDRLRGSGATLDHTFRAPGRYRATLSVFGAEAHSDTLSLEFSVEPAAGAVGRPRCGGTLIRSARLTENLTCRGQGITIAASGVTLDLGGFTLRGSGLYSGIRAQGDVPLRNVRIINGQIRQFATGIHVEGVQGLRIEGVDVSETFPSTNNQDAGLVLMRATDVVADRIILKGAGLGHGLLVFGESEQVKIQNRSRIEDAGIFFPVRDGLGALRQDFSITKSILQNVAMTIQDTYGIRFTENQVVGFDDGIGDGIDINSFRDVIVTGNTFEKNSAGLVLIPAENSNALVDDNTFQDNHELGMRVSTGNGATGEVTVTNNRFFGNGLRSLGGHGAGLMIDLAEAAGEARASEVIVKVGGTRAEGNQEHAIHAQGPPGTIVDLGDNRAVEGEQACLIIRCSRGR